MKTFLVGVFSAVACASFTPVPAVGAETLGIISVADPPNGPGPDLAELTHQLRSVVSERTQGVLEAAQLRERMTGQSSNASLAELDRAYAGALASYQVGDFDGSIRTLRAVIEDLEKLPDGPEPFAQWTRAMMRLARAEGTLGHKVEAREALERLVRATPNVKADPSQYPPSFQKQIDDVRAQLKGLPNRKLVVTATPSGKQTRIYVDGRDVGAAPVTIALQPGKYRVSGTQGNVHVPGINIDLSGEDQSLVLNFGLAEAMRPSFGPGMALAEPDRARNLIMAGAWLGVDRLLTTSLTSEGDVTFLVGTMYDVRRGMLQREGRVRLAGKAAPAGHLTALANFLIRGQTDPVVAEVSVKDRLTAKPVSPGGIVLGKGGGDPSPANGYRTMGWIAVGTGVLTLGLGTVAIIEGLSVKSSYNKARELTDSTGNLLPGKSLQTYNKYLSDGDSARGVAIGTGVGAGISLAATGILGYIAYRQTGEVGPFRF
jgi:hypothetical protein